MHKSLFINKNQIKLIHVAKREVGMSDGEYRALLGSVGATSSKQLTQSTFDAVMRHFERLGFRTGGEKKRLMAKISHQLSALDKSERYADGMAKKMFSVERLRWCNPHQLGKIVAALNYQHKREVKKRA